VPEIAGFPLDDMHIPGGKIEWSAAEAHAFAGSPDSELGRTLMRAVGEVVLAGAKRRALRRTGKMIAAMRFEVDADEHGVFTAVISPVTNAKGFNYALVHEDAHPRDRRPHRSLVPAMQDVRKLEGVE
jgi:hypothetical protein